MAARVSATRFVGRTSQLAELEAAWRDAAGGRAAMAFLAGESGVGKSRLLGALATQLREEGSLVLSGDCVDLGEGELPYAPLVAALRPLARAGHPALGALPGDLAAEVAQFLPGLTGDGAGTQARLFEALLALLGALTETQPVALIVEDLHWADRDTRAFLSFLGRSICAERLLVLGSYRPDELHRRHPLRPLLAQLEREPRSRRVELAPLTPEELAEQLDSILGAPAEPALVRRLFERSEGNPLHTEELLAAGLDGRGALPPTLRDALAVRIERLPAPAQEVVRLLGAAGRLDHGVLAAASDLDPSELRDALREAVADHILIAHADGTYAFRHALLREVVEDDLLPGERTHLHSRLAQALEARVVDGETGAFLTAAIAHHHLAAGDQPRALSASIAAAAAAREVHAYGSAADQLERALGLWARVPDAAERAGTDEPGLLLQAAEARLFTGDRSRQEALLRRAVPLLDEAAEPERVAIALAQTSRAQWSQGRHDEALATQDHALGLLVVGDGPPTAARAQVLASAAKLLMLRARFQECITVGREALAVARAVGDTDAETYTLNALGVALMWSGERTEGEKLLVAAETLSRELNRPDELASAHLNLADALHGLGASARAMGILRAALAEPLGPGSHQRRWVTMSLVEVLLDLGRADEAAAAMPEPTRATIGSLELYETMGRGHLALLRGQLDAAQSQLGALADRIESYQEPQFTGPYSARRAELFRRAGELAAARTEVETGLDRIVTCTDDASRVAQIAAVGVTVEADAAQRARDLGDPEAERAALARAEQHFSFVDWAGPDRPVEAALALSARGDLNRAQGLDDPGAWAAARREWIALDRRTHAATAGVREAEAHLAREDRAAAAEALAGVIALAGPAGLLLIAADARELAARARLTLPAPTLSASDPAPAKAAPAPPVAADPFGLTPRERQVLGLLARGETNRQIGEALYMAEKTASVHVSRILAKLDVPNRTQAAAVAVRLGLSAPAAPA